MKKGVKSRGVSASNVQTKSFKTICDTKIIISIPHGKNAPNSLGSEIHLTSRRFRDKFHLRSSLEVWPNLPIA